MRTSSWRASMSARSRPSGPVNEGDVTWVMVASGRRPFAERDRQPRARVGGHDQFASSARRSSSPNSASRGSSWSRISATVRGEQPAARGELRGRRRMRLEPPDRRAPARARPPRRATPTVRSAGPSENATRGQTPVSPLPASWRRPATSTSCRSRPRRGASPPRRGRDGGRRHASCRTASAAAARARPPGSARSESATARPDMRRGTGGPC